MLANFYQNITDERDRWQIWFWLILLLAAPVGSILGSGQTIPEALWFRLVGLVSKMLAAYLIAYYLIPRFFYRKRYFAFFLGFAAVLMIIPVIARLLNVHVAEAIFLPGEDKESFLEIITQFGTTFQWYYWRVFPMAYWFVFLKIGIDQLRGQRQLDRLQQEKTVAELNFLKAQIHPHFLFNTLNNLYTLTLDKSDEAPEVVVRLSEMLDYLLYKCRAARVPVHQEIKLLENYLGLETLRYGDRLDLSFRHSVDDSEAAVSPLILLSPVENAFKHGTSGAVDRPAVDIALTVREGHLHFRVWNTKPAAPPTDERAYTAGIGLPNVRRQLALTYPNQHELTIIDEAETYMVDIRIEL